MNPSSDNGHILIIEDDPYNGPFTQQLLQSAGFRADLVESAELGLEFLENNNEHGPDMILLDVNLPGMDGLETVGKLKAHPEYQYIPVIIFTVHNSLEYKILGLNSGGDDYLIKPYEPDELIARVNAMLRIRRLYSSLRHERQMNRRLTQTLDRSQQLANLLGRSPQMRSICDLLLDISTTNSHVLIQGESGTGKEVIAKAIHDESLRKNGPFVVINCAAYAETLLHSELFGHEKGAFTGAIRRKPGRFEQADGGTIFLDEIGEVSLPTQVILLRVIQEGRFERVGGEETLSSNARIIAATNRNLKRAMAEGIFREDLYWRLNVISINVPPLRDRKEDIPQLVANFIERYNVRLTKNIVSFSPEAMDLIFSHNWPGNVRELENVVERSMVLAKHEIIGPEHLPSELRAQEAYACFPDQGADLEFHEKEHIRSVLEQCDWNKYKAARMMGISRSTLYSKIRKHGLDRATGTAVVLPSVQDLRQP
ncbi:MAG: sigma-54-dependent Fis family transcriptional regulator [Desulfomonile tiedjei]|uniref:Sigma-54-dependent Fis family transcriptional regulator n=1 Tax=Desulfomonile tiedjei TaxID=2358 RepID=A0A9D6V9D5_9BACT|nr:sigma-54-dependent Fis family transcriptional regulator [Desulfomonile tiedjei]